jgi:hypothetical protein
MLTEGYHAAEFLVSEANGTRSRDNIRILGGEGGNPRVLTAGMVLGKRQSGVAPVAAAVAGNTGNGAMSAVVMSGAAKAGVYRLTIIEPGANAGVYKVEDPDGIEIGTGTVAVAFNKGGLSFTLADGATDFIAGDSFTIAVTPTAELWLQYDDTVTTGEQIAAGILRADVTAPDGVDVDAVAFVRDCEVDGNEVIWPDAAGTSALFRQVRRMRDELGIVLR